MSEVGYVIYKHNPHDLKEKVRVTTSNINNIRFKNTREAATSQRLLNRSIQEMDKPLVTEVVKKEVKHHVVEEMDPKELEPVDVVTKNKKETNKEVKVDKPDAFKK